MAKRPQDPTERAEQITRDLREATAEAAGVLKDMTALRKEFRALLDEATERLTDRMGKRADQAFNDFQHYYDKNTKILHDWYEREAVKIERSLPGFAEQIRQSLMAQTAEVLIAETAREALRLGVPAEIALEERIKRGPLLPRINPEPGG